MIRANKDAVRAAFSSASGTYNASSPLQREVGEALISFIREHCKDAVRIEPFIKTALVAPAIKQQGLILDAGCGTGRLSTALKREYISASVIGCDFAMPMLIEAHRAQAIDRLVGADLDAMPFKDNLFNLVASNLAYQWPPDALASFREAGRVLKAAGCLALTTLGPQTLFEMRASCAAASMPIAQMEFLELDEVAATLIKAGLTVSYIESKRITRQYPDMRSLMRALRDIGAMPRQLNAASTLIKGVLLKKAGRIYCKRFPGPSGGIIATYDVIFAAARKA